MNKTVNIFNGTEAVHSINIASIAFSDYVKSRFDPIGMKSSYKNIMFPLMEKDGITQLDLVKLTGLKAPTISITLRNMERDGIVRREKNENDRRETYVYITDKGRDIFAKATTIYNDAERILLSGLSEEELASLIKLMNKMADNLNSQS